MTLARDALRERWRVAAVEAANAADRAARAKDGREIFLEQLIDTLMQQDEKLSHAAAKRMATTSDSYKSYMKKMHDLRKHAAMLKIAAWDADKRYWESVSAEATYRAEARASL